MGKRVFAYGLVALQYTGGIDVPCRSLVHERKNPILQPNDIILVDEVTGVLLVRGGNYKKLNMDGGRVSSLFVTEDEPTGDNTAGDALETKSYQELVKLAKENAINFAQKSKEQLIALLKGDKVENQSE
jgi:hypothetical protein